MVVVVVSAMVAALTLTGVQQAEASTLNGVATIAKPGLLTPLPSGGSTTPFTVTLPPNAACTGDTATGGYHVYSYLVTKGTALSGVTFVNFPSTGYGFVDNTGLYYGPANTAIGTGQIVGIPNNFEWAPLVTDDSVPLPTLLYTSGTSGVWEAGLVCANTNGTVTDNWNTEVTFTASGTDPNGFVWSAIPGPSGSEPSAITSASSTSFTEGSSNTFTVTTTGNPTPTVTESGALPTGVTFAGNVLSGTPTETGAFPIVFTAANGIGADATQDFTLSVGAAPTVTGVTPSSGPAAGGTTVTIAGTNLSGATSVKFGTATAAIVSDTATSITATSPAGTDTVDVTVTTPGGASSTSPADHFTYQVAPAITSAGSTTFTEGSAGSFTVTATGSPVPTIAEAGALPAGVTFADGVLSGTPTATGTFPITFTAANGVGSDAVQDFTLTVQLPPLVVASTGLAGGTVGTSYSQTLAATGGQTPYTWSIASGALPAGLSLDASTGTISGTPSTAGTATFTVRVTDADIATATRSESISVEGPAVPSPSEALTQPVVGMASTPSGDGYWLVDAAGHVSAHGTAQNFGSASDLPLVAPIVRLVPTSDGKGYWLVAADGGVFAFGDATFYGSLGGHRLDAPIVAMVATTDDKGYWLVGADGGVFSFGDAAFHGSLGGQLLNAPIVGITVDPATGGYWLVGADGGVFSFDASFLGAASSLRLNQPVSGIAATPDGLGYTLVARDGGVFTFGDATFHGSAVGIPVGAPIVSVGTDTVSGGYWLASATGGVFSFDAPFYGAG
ncbi:MAG: putative Ig domain-containing protein [Acidimicrobiales bacterium]